MSAKNTQWALSLIKLFFHNQPVALVGDASGILGSAAAGNFYIAAHTADPELDGDQTTHEAAFGGYQRATVERSAGKWTCDLVDAEIGPARARNAASIAFPVCTSGSATITHLSVGVELSGAGLILYSGALTEARSVTVGNRLVLDPGDLVLTED